jgi:hypothetical protein
MVEESHGSSRSQVHSASNLTEGAAVSSPCEEKLRKIQFRLQDRLETVRAAMESYSEELENAEAEKNDRLIHHDREIIRIFEKEEKEVMAILEIAESGKSNEDQA